MHEWKCNSIYDNGVTGSLLLSVLSRQSQRPSHESILSLTPRKELKKKFVTSDTIPTSSSRPSKSLEEKEGKRASRRDPAIHLIHATIRPFSVSSHIRTGNDPTKKKKKKCHMVISGKQQNIGKCKITSLFIRKFIFVPFTGLKLNSKRRFSILIILFSCSV